MRDQLLKEVKARLLDFMKTRGQVSVDEAVEELGLAKTTVRQHLLLLERQGLVLRDYQKRQRGRPQLVFGLSSAAEPFYPSQESDLLRELLNELMADGHEAWLNQFFARYWKGRLEKFNGRLVAAGDSSYKTRVKVLRELLIEEGFMPEVTRKKSGEVIVRECNCPFRNAIQATEIPCRLEAQFIQKALQRPLSRVSYMPKGHSACTYELQAKGS